MNPPILFARPSTVALAAAPLLLFASACVVDQDPSDPEDSVLRVGKPQQLVAHPSVSTLVINGHKGSGASHTERCHAVLIAPKTALTAAHCFKKKWPALGGSVELFGQVLEFDPIGGVPWTDRVHIKPAAINQDPWTSEFGGVADGSDLAIIDLASDATGSYTVAKLFVPAMPSQLNWQGTNVVSTGHDGTWGQPAIGEESIVGMVSASGGDVLRGSRSPSFLQPGDSGGGAFLVPQQQFGASVAATSVGLGVGCQDGTVGGSTDQVLVGIASRAGDDWAPTFTYGNRWWIANTMRRDRDSDGWCDDEDNCAEINNPGQENCNGVAEVAPAWGFDGSAYGDVCDPAPCGEPELVTTGFVGTGIIVPWAAGGNAICWAELGRTIDDRLLRTPHNAVGESAVTTGAATAYFCACVDANGDPSSDPAVCSAAPNYCRLDPNELSKPEGGGSMDPDVDGVTFWHEMSLETTGGVGVSQPLSVTYIDGAPQLDHRWAYLHDFADWVEAGWFFEPPQDAQHGSGTDLAGIVWARDVSTAGIEDHGRSNCSGDPTCSLVDGFAFSVQPDRRDAEVSCKELPETKPPPWWTYCAACLENWSDLQQLVNPAPFVTVHAGGDLVTQWLDGAARDVTAAFGPAVREMMTKPGLVFAGPSESLAANGFEGVARGFVIDTQGIVVGGIRSGEGAFELTPMEMSLGLQPEQPFAATYSVAEGRLYAVGPKAVSVLDLDAEAPMLLEVSAELERPTSVLRHMPDGALYVVHGSAYELQLSRISLDDGTVEPFKLKALVETEQAWLTQSTDGRVVLVTSGPDNHAVWLLGHDDKETLASKLVDAGDGPIVHAPFVDGDQVRTSHAVKSEFGLSIEPISYSLPTSTETAE